MADNKKNEIDEELVRHLTRLLEENNLTEIEYGRDGWHIKVGRGGGVTVSESRRGNLEPQGAPAPGASESAAPDIDLANAVTSPMVGVVFTGPEPDAPPFIKAGVAEAFCTTKVNPSDAVGGDPPPRGLTVNSTVKPRTTAFFSVVHTAPARSLSNGIK